MTSAREPTPVAQTSSSGSSAAGATRCYGLLGNPNTGKTTLFNRLCGIRAKTANFPGSTVEAHVGAATIAGRSIQLVDLPGIYGLNLDLPESKTCKRFLAGEIDVGWTAQAVITVLDATNLRRNLVFVSQVLQQGLPAIVALNMSDLAERHGLKIDVDELAERIGCPVIPICARTGDGVDHLMTALGSAAISAAELPEPTDARQASIWANRVFSACVHESKASDQPVSAMTDRLDRIFTHPVLGLGIFAVIMAGVFWAIFALAAVPMDLIDLLFEHLGGLARATLPAGAIQDLIVDGVIAGVAGTIVFLPQICLLFFLISLLEDTGYLSRAAFVMDRLLRRFGLPGQAFVPLLSAHACAIPAIMSARLIPDRRDRIATVLVAPFMSCSARLPVYVLLVGILFADQPLLAGIAFTGCYVLGAVAALLTALVFRRSILRGRSRPMVLELPSYKTPSLRTALLIMFDRGFTFLKKAGTVIVGICIILWWMSAYPKAGPSPDAGALRAQASDIAAEDPERAVALEAEAEVIDTRYATSRSAAGRVGRAIEPVLAPLGFDWQLGIAVTTSFAAREVFVSTLAVLFAGTSEADEAGVLQRIAEARRDDGSPLFTRASAASCLVFYVLAMQCLPTLPVTRREAGHWGWAMLQLVYMSGVAYVAALCTFQGLRAMGVT